MEQLAQKVQVIADPALSRFATDLKKHDIFYRYADDSRAFARGAAEYDTLIDLARALPRGEVLALVELRAQKAFCCGTMGEAARRAVEGYLTAFESAMDRGAV